MTIESLLRLTVERRASDLHLSSGLPPLIRIDGDLEPVGDEPLNDATLRTQLFGIMTPSQQAVFKDTLECDFSTEITGLSRFRINVFMQSRGIGAVMRGIPTKIPSLGELGAPKLYAELAMRPRGLVLVTGPTGSGKSTTLAAMIDHVNGCSPSHILTVEDPVEFVHSPKRALINQRELGSHTHSFSNALRASLREDPDIILVGEMRDLETIRLALTAAETGHLVFGTLHTTSAPKTIDRIIDVFPGDEKGMVRAMLSESLEAVISQTLCKKKGGGRVAAAEIMLGTSGIRNLVREGKVPQMYSAIQTGGAVGMQTLDQSLSTLVKQGLITSEEAKLNAKAPETIP